MTDALDDFESEGGADEDDPAAVPTFASEAEPTVAFGNPLDEFPIVAAPLKSAAVSSDPLGEFPIAIAPAPLTLIPAEAFDDHRDVQPTLPERSSSSFWMVAAALLVGLGCGFGGGYWVGGGMRLPDAALRGAAPALAQVAAPSPPAPAARDYTESALPDPPVVAEANHRDPSRDAGGVQPQTEASTAPGRLLVRSTPADAQVFIDGREQGRTPATIRDLAPGAHRLRVVHEGYVAADRSIAVTAERPAQSVTMSLERSRTATASAARAAAEPPAGDGTLVGALDVESRPPDAQVFLDGTLVGTTPFASPRIGAGRHEIRLELGGYRRWQSSVQIVSGERNRITASLEQ